MASLPLQGVFAPGYGTFIWKVMFAPSDPQLLLEIVVQKCQRQLKMGTGRG